MSLKRAFIIVVLILGIGGICSGYYFWSIHPIGIGNGSAELVELRVGEPLSVFAARLEDRGLMRGSRNWSRIAQLVGMATQSQAGEYWVYPSDTRKELLKRIVSGDVVTYQIRIIEGWTVNDLLSHLRSQENLILQIRDNDPENLLEVLGIVAESAEGMFLPDTYQFVKGNTDIDILRRAYDAMQHELKDVWSKRANDLPYETAYDLLTVASLIEKETGMDEDRAKIGQVFLSRLKEDMRLQTDPSVIFGLGAEFDGDLRKSDLRRDTSYNTYLYKGLPPSPISLPGRSSLLAAAKPAGTNYRYFVAKGDGSSHFSETLAEHNAAVTRYQLRQLK